MSIYTMDMAVAMRKIKKPFDFTFDVADDGSQLNLLLYKSEFDEMTPMQHLDAMDYALQVAYLFESYGAKVNIQGVAGAPGRV